MKQKKAPPRGHGVLGLHQLALDALDPLPQDPQPVTPGHGEGDPEAL